MPEFVMENRNECFREESPFVAGFIETLFFTESSRFNSSEWFEPETQEAIREGQSDGNIPNDMGYCDLHPDSLAAIRKFCADWQEEHKELLTRVYAETDYSEEQCGRDFFYTHCGHGVGFSDREELAPDDSEYERLTAIMVESGANSDAWGKALSERNAIEEQGFAALLTKAAGYGEISPFFGDHVENGNAPFVYVEMY